MVHEVVKEITVPNIIKKSDDFDPKNFKIMMRNMASRVCIESSLVAICEIAAFEHVKSFYLIPGTNYGGLLHVSLSPLLSIGKQYCSIDQEEYEKKNSLKRADLIALAESYFAEPHQKWKAHRHVYPARYHQLISVVFEESFFKLPPKKRIAVINKIENNLKRSRACYRLVKSDVRSKLNTAIHAILSKAEFHFIDKSNYQDKVNDFMPYGWGSNRESVLITEAIAAPVPEKTQVKKNKI